jgi:hypothetical protein
VDAQSLWGNPVFVQHNVHIYAGEIAQTVYNHRPQILRCNRNNIEGLPNEPSNAALYAVDKLSWVKSRMTLRPSNRSTYENWPPPPRNSLPTTLIPWRLLVERLPVRFEVRNYTEVTYM